MLKMHRGGENHRNSTRKNRKRILSQLLILLLVLTLTGCSTGDKDDSDTMKSEISESQSGESESEIEDDGTVSKNENDPVIENLVSEDKDVTSNDKSTDETASKEKDNNQASSKDSASSEQPVEDKSKKENNSKDAPSKDTPQDSKDKTTVRRTGLKVHFVDVGQGDGIVVEADGRYMVIDGGDNEYGSTMVNYLKDLGVKKIDYVIGTHPHADHVGGLDDVINNFEIKKVILSPKMHTSRTFEDVLDAMLELDLSITKPVVGDVYQLGSSEFTIIAPNREYGNDLNDWSVGIKLVYGENSFVLYGDGEIASEYDIVDNGIDLKADVLKSAHHGSDTSNSEAILKAVDPEYVVISVGVGNSYGHPSRSIIDRFVDYDIPYFRTDEQGTVIASSDGSKITWNMKPSTSLKSGDEQEAISNEDKKEAVSKEVVNKDTSAKVTDNKETENKETTDKGNKDNISKDKSDNSNSKEVVVFITKTGSKYHRETCSSLRKSSIESTLEEALGKGLEPCSKCNPPS